MDRPKEEFVAPDARVLVVDDNNINLLVVKELLKITKVQVVTATGGREAVDIAKKEKFDVIFLDQRMPGMDGTETLKAMKEEISGFDTPVICLTADAVAGAKEQYIAKGFTDYLTKPISPQDMNILLRKYIKS